MLFASLKCILGLGRLRLRGLNEVNNEFLRAATAQDPGKFAEMLPAPRQTKKARLQGYLNRIRGLTFRSRNTYFYQ
ncbi:hypothetical protein SAMN06265370_1404 [Puniceibacterium sediminis]|uniref:Uncharacterized protein n=1 Tax=Puniceibacterium sediminis TaxID=1608407 RepID=A0A238ZSG8_9RHOB|nr:hypothetical protein SAMN06265370_1404 [Puniceibacterium sediminis]